MIFPLLLLDLYQKLLQLETGKALPLTFDQCRIMSVLEVKFGARKISAFSEHTC